MGKLIDIDKARKEYSNLTDLTMNDTTLLLTLFGVLDNAPTVEAIPKADYENRLKADMVAMLTELQSEIEKIEIDLPFGFEPVSKTEAFYEGVSASSSLIQQKINSLKEAKDENEH